MEHRLKITGVALIFIMVLAFGLRVFGINWGLPSKDYYFSYQGDEAAYIKILSRINPKKLDFNLHIFPWGAWHYYELGGVIGIGALLNIITLSQDKYFYYSHPWEMAKIYLAGRFLSVLFALLTVILAYIIAKRLFSKRAGLLAAFFVAINPAHIIHSHFLKADTSVAFWVLLLLFCCVRLVESGLLKWYILAGISSAFAYGAQLSGICFIHTVLIAHILKEYSFGAGFSFKRIFGSKKIWAAYFSAVVTYLIICPYSYLSPREFFSGVGGLLSGQAGNKIDAISRSNVLFDTIAAFNLSFTPFFLILGFAGLLYAFLSKNKRALLAALWLLPYLFIMVIMGALETRFQILIIPGLFILGAGLIMDYYARIKKVYFRMAFNILVAIFSLYAIIYAYAYDKALAEKPVQLRAAEWLAHHIGAKEKIGIGGCPEIRNYPTIIHQSYYYKNDSVYNIINLRYSVDNLARELPAYLIISKREGFNLLGEGRDGGSAVGFMKKIREKYRIIKVFEGYPCIFGRKFEPALLMNDWEMPFPVIYLLQKIYEEGKIG